MHVRGDNKHSDDRRAAPRAALRSRGFARAFAAWLARPGAQGLGHREGAASLEVRGLASVASQFGGRGGKPGSRDPMFAGQACLNLLGQMKTRRDSSKGIAIWLARFGASAQT